MFTDGNDPGEGKIIGVGRERGNGEREGRWHPCTNGGDSLALHVRKDSLLIGTGARADHMCSQVRSGVAGST